MKVYAQFFKMTVNYDGNHPEHLSEACGSDGVFILDGRCCLQTMEHDTIQRQLQLNGKYEFFQIRKSLTGRLEPYRVLYSNFGE